MRLSTKNEWIVVGLLSLYVAFVPQIPMAREFMSTGIGRLSAMASVIFTWKYVSELVAVLLAIVYIRCMVSPIWEGLEMPPTTVMPPTVASVAPVSAATTTMTAAPTTMPPPSAAVSTAPITIAGAGTAMSTTPAPPVATVGGVQPATSTMSMPVSVPVTVPV
jgi:hypothetical protein